MRKVARDTINLLTPLAARHNTSIVLAESSAVSTALIDPDQIQQVLANLLVNALQARAGGGGRVEVDIGDRGNPAHLSLYATAMRVYLGTRLRHRDLPRQPEAYLRSLLHDEKSRRGDRTGLVNRIRNYPGARRPH